MRRLSILMLVALLLGAVPVDAADYYKLPNIMRIEKDLYRSADVIIETRFCFHVAIGEEALLRYDGPGEYEIIWPDRSICEVQKVVAVEGRDSKIAKFQTQNRAPNRKSGADGLMPLPR